MHAQKTRVACVGNSVTYGAGIKDRSLNSYPSQLQKLLGSNYHVANFGHSGATMLKNGHKPYWTKQAFKQSQDFAPNIVIIHLGLNDQGNNNWPKHKEAFIPDYLDMISTYKKLPSKPRVIICKMTPTFSGHHWFEEGMRESFKDIQNKIETIANTANVELINLHEPLYRFPEFFPDNLHPTKDGAAIIAKKVYSAITGDYGGLQLPKYYGENMVFQRHEPIVISGTANINDHITVQLNSKKASTTVTKKGVWKVSFPAMNAGGPFALKIQSKLSKTIQFNQVYIGEVWLASGQSNMDFKVQHMLSAKSVLKDSLNPNIFVLSMDPKVLKGTPFTEKERSLCNTNDYFESSGWSNTSDKILENFSAVAYAYAYNLQKSLNVPIGIICNAVGGSPTQSWISRECLEQTHETISLLNDSWQNPLIDSWVSLRKSENFGHNKNLKGRHPYDATFLFDSGILPLTNFNFKGVIWYQGESNTEHVDLHSRLFKMLIKDWRIHFKKPEFPFYYVQLSSINRPNWGTFRDAQRKLLHIKNTGMAVSLDVGHKTDVHPKQKWILGERLARIALNKSYKKPIAFSGPLLDYVNVMNDKLEVYFKHSEGLKTKDDTAIKDIIVAGEDKVFLKAQTKIKGNKLIVWSQNIKKPRYVKYGYSSYTNGNLVNKSNLPASTFSNLKE
ncbi:GDSL-type esterase/lipase family protein [Snuella sedimenti]|uniref:Sialate O-acetylesterase n=1 Tax=Snuella sedimenti TaxID=2798802 RepID=A0A8J7LY19_9FLAO|nr:GDSL-type esterase/lipase family protein [Snuella sedimenti]MBJ6367811.1 sialate O-acetylesterase [Snuella sedimenti]